MATIISYRSWVIRPVPAGSAAKKKSSKTRVMRAVRSPCTISSFWFWVFLADIMLSLTTPVITDSRAQEEKIVKTTKSIFMPGYLLRMGSTLRHSSPFMSTKRLNMEVGTVPKSFRVSMGMLEGSSNIAPCPITRVVNIATVYKVTSVNTSTQNMLCMASMTPRAKRYRGLTTLTRRSSRRMRNNRSIRMRSKISPNSLLRCWPRTMDIHKFNIHWSKTPNTTIRKSRQFQIAPSSVKNCIPCRRNRTKSSNKKNARRRLSMGAHNGDWMSVSRPIMKILRMITKEARYWNQACSVQLRFDLISMPKSFTSRSSRNARSTGTQCRKAIGSAPPKVTGSTHWSTTPEETIMTSNRFHFQSCSCRKNQRPKCRSRKKISHT
mmetsp:Transcript_17286/g.60395  ORF Transcript_17286/g.60395 Transcript_17286/m.60395 type:complete len:379 (-) Transcript_17286:459-1595(-)